MNKKHIVLISLLCGTFARSTGSAYRFNYMATKFVGSKSPLCSMRRLQQSSGAQYITYRTLPNLSSSLGLRKLHTVTNREKQLLSRLIHAHRQKDQATIDETLAFIENKFPALLPKAMEIANNGFKGEQLPQSDSVKPGRNSSFYHFGENIYDWFWSDTDYSQPPSSSSSAQTVEDLYYDLHKLIQAKFKERAYSAKITINPLAQPPKKTWWEIIAHKESSYRDRLFPWIFNIERMTFECAPLTQEDKALFFERWQHYVDTMCADGYSREQALTKLQENTSWWSPVMGHLRNQRNQSEAIRQGIKLFGTSYAKAIKDHPTLLKIIQENTTYFDITDADCSYGAGQMIWKHMCALADNHKEVLEGWLREFSKQGH